MICPLLSISTAMHYDQHVNAAQLHVIYCLEKECSWWVEDKDTGERGCAILLLVERLPK